MPPPSPFGPPERGMLPPPPEMTGGIDFSGSGFGLRWSHYRVGHSPVDADGLFAWTKPESAAGWKTLPAPVHEEAQLVDDIWLAGNLPPNAVAKPVADPYLMFRSVSYEFEVFSGSKRLYSSSDLATSADRWHVGKPVFVSLEAFSPDQPIMVHIHSKRDDSISGKIGPVIYGSQADLKIDLIKRDIVTIVSALIYFMIGFVALLMFTVTRDNRAALYFALFALSICGNQLLALISPELFVSYSDWKRYLTDPLHGLTMYWFSLYFIHTLQPIGKTFVRMTGRGLLAAGLLLAGCKLLIPGTMEEVAQWINHVERLGFSLLCAICLVIAAKSLRKDSDSDAKWFVSGLSVYLIVNMIGHPLRYYVESNVERFIFSPIEFIHILDTSLEYSLLFGTCFFGIISFKRYAEVYEATRNYNIQLTHWNRTLEAKVQERTRSIQNLLDNAGQGFLTVNEQLLVQAEHSSECKRIFERDIVDAQFVELLYPEDAGERAFHEDIFNSVFQGDDLQREVCLSLLPADIDIWGKRISLQYKWIAGMGTEPDKVMIVMTDTSERLRMEHQMAKERQALHMVVWVVKHYRDFKEMIAEYRKFTQHGLNELLQGALTPVDKWSELYRAIHTFKGNFAQIDFIHTTERLHEFESRLVEWKSRIADEKAKSSVSPAFAKWLAGLDLLGWLEEDLRILRDILGDQYDFSQDVVTIELGRLRSLERQVYAILPSQEALLIVSELKKLKYRPFRELLDVYPDYTARLAERSGKALHPIRIVGGEQLVDPDAYSEFTRSLIHIFRNMVDHGIEMPEQRASVGKDKRGTILCEVEITEQELRLSVSNDGKEIDRTAIREQALAKKLYTAQELEAMPNDELFKLLFREQFSTKEWISKVSGRGIGLAAVRKALARLGGSVRVESDSGSGTVFTFTIPLAGPVEEDGRNIQ
ncbi:MAG: hypothetical protein K0Q59_172 [Paenibacillus sp.]|nr:hypothetical protein [Paenibacillus sp.]